MESITKDINLGELSQIYPDVAKFLQEDYGLHCIGCFANMYDTLETGLKLHGYETDEVERVVEEVNRRLGTKHHG